MRTMWANLLGVMVSLDFLTLPGIGMGARG